jgi:cell division septation protein DedD
MRAVALLLVIANLAYLGWATLVDAPADTPAASSQLDPSVPQLVLASEKKVATERAAGLATSRPRPTPAAQSTPTVSENGSQCISIGPFQDLPSATQASAALRTAGHDSRQRLEQGQLWVGYWVSVSGFGNREEAERAVTKLKQSGLSDVYISLSGGGDAPTNIVSLGVFKESERAQRMLREAKQLGFDAQISDRTRAGSVYWIDIDFAKPTPNFDFSILGSEPGKILRLEQLACPQKGG